MRDIVIGMADGLTVPFALAAGLTGAVDASKLIVVAGLAGYRGSIAMGWAAISRPEPMPSTMPASVSGKNAKSSNVPRRAARVLEIRGLMGSRVSIAYKFWPRSRPGRKRGSIDDAL